MKVFLNCCSKPASKTLFKGEKASVETKTQVKPATQNVQKPQQDTVEIAGKKSDSKCVCECKCETCK